MHLFCPDQHLKRLDQTARTAGMKLATGFELLCQQPDPHQLAKVGLNHQREHIPPVDSQVVDPAAKSQLQQLPNPMSILKPIAEIVQTDDPASRILAPTPVG